MAFVGADWNAYIELVYDLEEHPPYALGNRYEHLALEVEEDLGDLCDRLRAAGVRILSGPKMAPGGDRSIAFVEDPNGIPVVEPLAAGGPRVLERTIVDPPVAGFAALLPQMRPTR